MQRITSDPIRALALLSAAVLCAGLANGVARSDRRLAWSERAPVPDPTPPRLPAPAPAAMPGLPVPAATPAPPVPDGARKPASTTPQAPPRPAAARPRPAPAAPPAIPDQPLRFAPAQDQPVREITGDDAWAAHQRRIPFLDARRSSEYLEGHVAGAWSVPVWEADAAARITEFEARANPSPATPIVIYCSGGDCHDSRILAQRLVQLGYRNLLIYTDGWPDWIQQGRPRAQGARP